MRRVMTVCTVAVIMAMALPVPAMTLEEILENNYEARGGVEAWEAVETARMTGTMKMMASAAGGIEAPFTIEFKRPNKMRLEFSMQGMTGVQAFDGETGWMIMPFMGKTEPETMAGEQLEQVKDQADFEGPLMNWEAKGHTIELLGEEEVDGTPAYKLQVTRADGNVDIVYLDAEYFIEFKSVSKRSMQGVETELSTVVGDYKEVDGLMFAHSMEVGMNGQPPMQVITLESIEVNPGIDDERFAMPEVEAAAPAAAE
jgi:outer membrane lipoprotein-sorting protein